MGKRDITKRHIIEKTAKLFNQKGYAATSLQDLTQATGLTKGSIYGNFKNKDELALSSFAHNARLRKRSIIAELKSAGTSSLDRLLVYPRVFRKRWQEISKHGGCPIVNTSIDAADTHESLLQAVRDTIEDWRKAIKIYLQRGMQTGELRQDINVEKTAALIIGLVEGSMWMVRATGKTEDLNAILEHAESVILGLAKES